jgi:hypothetical protein
MDEVPSNSHSRFRVFGFWKRYRARQDQKYVEAMSNPDLRQEVGAAKGEILESEIEAREECMRDGVFNRL